ncbi:reverse transcriptase domain-containing protein [Tanacetum coccineum]
MEDVPVIHDFPKVFPEELPGLPLPRQVEFPIDLGLTCCTLVAVDGSDGTECEYQGRCLREVIESHKSSTEHPIVNEFVIINIPEEDVEPQPNLPLQEIIILDPDDQPMWENIKIVAPTPNSAIVQPNVDDNFVINSTHLKMIWENKFDGYLRADPHDHIREFLAICDMFKYGETQSEGVKLFIFPFSLCDKAKTWFNELSEEFITSWEQMRRAVINRFFSPSLFNRLLLEIKNISQNVCESLTDACPNQAFQFLEDKVLFKLDWSLESKYEHHQKSIAFADGSNSNNDNYRLMDKLEALTIKMDSQFQSIKEEMHEMRKNYNSRVGDHASKNDDTLMCERHEVNYIQFEGYQNQNSHDSYTHQSHHDLNDFEKSLTELNNDVRNDLEHFKRCIRSLRTVHDKLFDRNDQSKTDLEKSIAKFLDGQRVRNMFFKNNVNDMIIKMKQNEKNCQTIIKNMGRKIDEWSKSQNVYSEQTERTDPPPPPQAHTEHVNAVFTGSGKSDYSLKILKDPPPPIIVNNKLEKDRPIKTSKRAIT